MSLSAAVLQKMLEKGLTLADVVEIAEVWEEGAAQPIPLPTTDPLAAKKAYDRERMRAKRWAEAEAKAAVERQSYDVVSDSRGDIGDATLSLPLPPQTPPTPTHTREGVTTRPRKGADDFERFWAAYPLKKAKDVARKAFPGALSKASVETMIAAVERQRTWDQWQRGFIPHPATWLNAGRWADEEDPPITASRGPHDRPHSPAATAPGRAARRGVWAEVLAEERGATTGFGD